MNIEEKINNLVSTNQLDKAIRLTEEKLAILPQTDFHKIIGRNLLHLTEQLINYIDKFYDIAQNEIEVQAIYSEMNGFTINYDLWFIDLFAFTECGGLDDLDWLADFEVSSDESMIISGFEDLQSAYEDYMENEKWEDHTLKEASEICELLIILRLQELFKEIKKLATDRRLNWVNISLFTTAHDSEMVYEAKV
jgi:hypothetical protein